jgi:hypothetical protein
MRKIFLIIAILAIVGFLASSIYQIFYQNQKAFDEKNITVKISGPQSFETGDSFSVTISYKNANRTKLKNAVLTLGYPRDVFRDAKDESGFGKIKDSSVTWDIGDVSSGYEGSVEISAKAEGVIADKLTAELVYEPENFSSRFSSRAEFSFAVKPAKISLSLFAPKEIVAGQEAKYILIYTNATSVNFDAIRIKFNHPAGFTLLNSNPPPAPAGGPSNFWEASNFTRASSGQIELTGILDQTGESTKTISAVIEQRGKDGKFIFNNEISADTYIVNSPFIITQVVNSKENYSAGAGEVLNYKIKLRNLDKANRNNLVVSAVLSGEAADFGSLIAENAVIDQATNAITWDAKTRTDLANMESDKELELSFSLKVKDKIMIGDAISRNFSIKNSVAVKDGNILDADGNNKMIISSSFDVKINSSVELFTRGYFNDDGRIKTFGPVPPKVGETTAYNIRWQILNSSNRIKNVKVAGVLPANVRWTGEVFPMDAKIAYDINTRMITWEARDLDPGTGILFPLKEVVFQVSITPTAQDVGNYLVLIGQNVLTATDDFTLAEISAKSDGITTRLPDDVSIGPNEGKVSM